MAEIISYPEKSILSGNDYLLISDSQNSYITKKTKVSDVNDLVFSNAIEGSGTTNYIPKFTNTIYDSGTNIGIGTTTPTQKLEVNGTVLLSTLPNNNGALYLGSVSTGFFSSSTTGHLDIQTSSSTRVRVNSNGNVGIGTTSPSSLLNVVGGQTKLNSSNFSSNVLSLESSFSHSAITFFADSFAASGMINISNSSSSGNNEVGMNFATGGFSSANVKLSILNTGQLKAHSYGSGTFTGTATQRLAVDTNGNVIELPIGSGPVDGSGTANYLTKWVDSDTIGNSIAYDSGSQLLLNATSSSTTASSKLYVEGDTWITGAYRLGNIGSTSQIGKLVIENNILALESSYPIQFKSGTNTYVHIGDYVLGGKIGIGTTNPTQKVVIRKSGFGSVNIGATTASGATLLAAGGDEDYGTFFATQSSSDNYTGLIQQRRRSAATFYNLALNPYGGNVGIGTTSPATKLHIDSNSSYPALTIARSTTHPNISFTAGVTNFSGPGADLVFDTVGNDTGFGFRTRNSSGTLINTLILNPSGNVGIGTTNPSCKLDRFRKSKITC